MAVIGDTVRLLADLYNWDDVLSSADGDVTVKVYDARRTVIETGTAEGPYDTGRYYYDLAIPFDSPHPLTCEVSGLLGGKSVARRIRIPCNWI